MKRKQVVVWLAVLAVFFMFPVLVFADGCMECHQKHGVKVKVPPAAPIKVMADGKEQVITLDRAFKFHGHECPGMTIGYLAVQYGINILFGDEIPARDDLLVTSRTAAAGVKDLIDLVMKGDRVSGKTWPPAGMKNTREGFEFNIVRKSTCEAVQVRLNEAFFPADFYPLKGKVREKSITDEEWQRLHGYMKNIIIKYPVTSPEKLFGKPGSHRIILWGTLQSGELDKNIRKMRQKERDKMLKGQGGKS